MGKITQKIVNAAKPQDVKNAEATRRVRREVRDATPKNERVARKVLGADGANVVANHNRRKADRENGRRLALSGLTGQRCDPPQGTITPLPPLRFARLSESAHDLGVCAGEDDAVRFHFFFLEPIFIDLAENDDFIAHGQSVGIGEVHVLAVHTDFAVAVA